MLQIEEDLTARINMADYRFSFHEKGKEYNPASIAPEGKIISFIIAAFQRCCRKVIFSVVSGCLFKGSGVPSDHCGLV